MKKMMRNSLMSFAYLPAVVALLALPGPLFAKQGVHIVGAEILVEETDPTAVPDDTVDGPLLDKMSDSGVLFGDLYRLLRYDGFLVDENGQIIRDGDGNIETQYKNVPAYCEDEPAWALKLDGTPDCSVVYTPGAQQVFIQVPAVGGEPVLTEDFATYTVDIIDENGVVTGVEVLTAPYPSQCVQPVADFERWGDISEKSLLSDNRIPLIKTYDPTWKRTECEVDPGLYIDVPEDGAGNPIPQYVVTGADGTDYYTVNDISWADLVQEVEFGRLNLARAPKAVLDASFDEAIRSLNAAEDIKIDTSGRLMVTTKIFDEFLTDQNGTPILIDTVTKAIDSPKENLALYLKLMQDGHLITPANERTPIDYSVYGGMPLTQLLDLVDGPTDAPRPTIDIEQMKKFGLGHLVDAADTTIKCYYIKREADGSLFLTVDGDMVITSFASSDDGSCACPEGEICEKGILDPSDSDIPAGDDFPVAASFFAAAADKKGNITVDKIVYINSILGINKVVGYSEDGTINYAKNPVYFNYNTVTGYDRLETFGQHRGRAQVGQPDDAPVYDGMFEFLELTSENNELFSAWQHTEDTINTRVFHDKDIVDPSLTADIGGFTSMADDDLQVIKFTHTYQIPGLR